MMRWISLAPTNILYSFIFYPAGRRARGRGGGGGWSLVPEEENPPAMKLNEEMPQEDKGFSAVWPWDVLHNGGGGGGGGESVV